MKKIDLGQTITILANVGVIAGIVFLGLELAQNNELLAAQARYNLRVQRAESNRMAMEPHVMEALQKYGASTELTPADQGVLSLHTLNLIEMWEWQYGEYEAGMLEADDLPVGAWRLWFHGQAEVRMPVKEIWEGRRDVLNSGFVLFMEENVVNER